jgi:4-hydroxy-tetrahydrodipicolinate synthase
MISEHALCGVYAAAVTPVAPEGTVDREALPEYLGFLANRGCHGALVLGTTGEGPSFSTEERLDLLRAAMGVRQQYPNFRILAGTGTPSLEETANLTWASFEMGVDGVVVLPPYYFKKVSDDGLFEWYRQVIIRSVPAGGYLLAYHIPLVTGVSLSIELIARLKDAFPEQFAGLKDSSGDPEHAQRLGQIFQNELLVLNGNDRLFSLALQNQASGCITALASLVSPLLRQVWNQTNLDEPDGETQTRLNAARDVLEAFPPAPAFVKEILHSQYQFPQWGVRRPLLPLPQALAEQAAQRWVQLNHV